MQRIVSHFKGQFVGYVALFIALGGAAYAAGFNPVDSNGVVHACYSTAPTSPTTPLSVVDSGASCPPGDTALNFNQSGPPGQPGAPGQAGVVLPGVNGTLGVNGLKLGGSPSRLTKPKILRGDALAKVVKISYTTTNADITCAFVENSAIATDALGAICDKGAPVVCPASRPVAVGWGTQITRGKPTGGVGLIVSSWNGYFSPQTTGKGYILEAGNGTEFEPQSEILKGPPYAHTTWITSAGGWPALAFAEKPSPALLASGKLDYLMSFDMRLTVYCANT